VRDEELVVGESCASRGFSCGSEISADPRRPTSGRGNDISWMVPRVSGLLFGGHAFFSGELLVHSSIMTTDYPHLGFLYFISHFLERFVTGTGYRFTCIN
jgi:hypothetical protein